MRQLILIGICAMVQAAFCTGARCSHAADEPKPKAGANVPKSRLLVPIRHLDAKELANKVEAVFNHDAPLVKVVPVLETNALLVSVPKDVQAEVVNLLEQLDQPQRMVEIDLWIVSLQKPGERIDGKDGFDENALVGEKQHVAEQLDKLGREGRLTVMNHFHVLALENHQAFQQQGAQVPRITATNLTPQGRVSSTRIDNVGSLVKINAQPIDRNRIKLQLEIEKSYVGSEERGLVVTKLSTGEEVRTPSNFTITLKNEVAVPSGRVVKVDGIERPPADEEDSLLVLVSAKVLPDYIAK